MAAPTPIPTPPNFPIRWKDPADEQLFWFQDLMHYPTPVTPLTASFGIPAFNEGATKGIQHLSLPIVAFKFDAFHSYVFGTVVPYTGTPEQMEARTEGMKAAIMSIIPGLMPEFYGKMVPRILEIVRDLCDRDYASMSLSELARHVVSIQKEHTELWDIHMQINIPPMGAVFGLDEFLASFLGPEVERTGHLMLQGFPNKSVESGHQLWEVAQQAKRDPALVKTLLETKAADLGPALARTASGRAFAERWAAFLDAYGRRTGGFEFAEPAWIEDPTVALNHLRAYLTSPDAVDPLDSQRKQAAERDRLVSETEAKLPAEVRPIFRMLLAGAQTYIPAAEDHNFYIDQMAFTSFRWPFLALGRALAAAGVIGTANDVFFLTLDEIAAVGRGSTPSLKAAVDARRADHERAQVVIPPEAIGTPPPADVPLDPLVTKFFGFGTELPSDARTLRGIASSGGVVKGTVKVVRTLDQAGKLEAGDIMVCHMTMPAWTPLFATVGAVVADSGGVLSHCSIVAREYGIPCVTATRIGTRTLRDGQQVTVDGNRGLVVIEG